MNDDVLIAFLLTSPGVANLVETRGYPYGELPQKTAGQMTANMPAFTVQSISEGSHHAIDSDGRPALSCFRPMRFQVNPYGTSGGDVYRLSEAIRAALDGFTGMMAGVQIGGVWGRITTPINFLPDIELFHRTMDFEIHVMGG